MKKQVSKIEYARLVIEKTKSYDEYKEDMDVRMVPISSKHPAGITIADTIEARALLSRARAEIDKEYEFIR